MAKNDVKLKKNLIERAYNNRLITMKQYEMLMNEIHCEEEQMKIEKLRKQHKKKKLIEKYMELSHT